MGKVARFIECHQDEIQDLVYFVNRIREGDDGLSSVMDPKIMEKHRQFEGKFTEKLSHKMDISEIVSFGPQNTGCNLLMVKDKALQKQSSLFSVLHGGCDEIEQHSLLEVLHRALGNGFQKVTARGPLCGEAMLGVGFIVSELSINSDVIVQDEQWALTQLMSSFRDSCVGSFLSLSPRLVQPMYKVFIQGTTDVLGAIYDVIGKRRGKITGDSIVEGTNLFDIYAVLPVIESFGFTEELRSETAGNVVPQLSFSHFEVIEEDPLWIPMTQSEIEEYGNITHNENDYKGDPNDYVKRLIQNVRTRKGLETNVQTVESAEKQSTRSRKK